MSAVPVSTRSTSTPRPDRSGLIRISTAGLLWGTTGVVVQLLSAATGLSPIGIGFYRLLIAALALLAVSGVRSVGVALRAAPGALVLTGVALGAYQALYFVAVTLGGVSVATVISLGLAPVLVAGWEAVAGRSRPSRTTTVSLTAGVTGLLLITLSTGRATEGAPHPLLGLLAAAGCGCVYAGSTVLSRHQAQRIEPLTLTAVATGVGALALAPAAFAGGLGVPIAFGPIALLAYLGVVTTAVAYALYYNGLRTTAGSTAAVLTLLEPLGAAGLAVLVLGEALPVPALVGGVLLLTAIGVLYLRPS